MDLFTLDEPVDIKKKIQAFNVRVDDQSSGVDWGPLSVWYGNLIPKYIWASWKLPLKQGGYTWQKFLRLMKYRTDDALLWIEEMILWEDFLNRVKESLTGSLGKVIQGR